MPLERGDTRGKAQTQAVTVYDPNQFMVLAMPPEEVREIITAALGGEGISARDLQRVKLPAGGARSWEVPSLDAPDGTESIPTLTGVIIAHRRVRAFWQGEYTGEKTPPQCYSDDAEIGHGDPGGDCATCQFAQWGSGKNSGQACKLMRLMFFLPENSFLPYVIALPPTSEGEGKRYITSLAAQAKLPWHVVTELGLERAQNNGGIAYSKATFRRAANLDESARKRMSAFAEELRPAIMRTRVDASDIEGELDRTDRAGHGRPSLDEDSATEAI